MFKLNGYLMSKDIKIARIQDSEVIPLLERLLPLLIKRGGDIQSWLYYRSVDRHRINSRLLKKVLRLSTAEDYEVALSVNGATITDTYWILLDGESLTYSDVKFKENYFDDLMLKGKPDIIFNEDISGRIRHTPELTNIGSFEKCWRLENGEWWLYKSGTKEQIFSEYFIYKLGKVLNFDMARYVLTNGDIKSLDFTNSATYNYEPAFSLLGEEEDYLINYVKILELGELMAIQYLDMLCLDTMCLNMDRHTFNYGFLRDVDTGDFLKMSPNFDNNIALISNGYIKNIKRENDPFIRDFLSLLSSINDSYVLPIVTESLIKEVLKDIPIDVNKDYVLEFIMSGYNKMKGCY